MTEGAVMEVFRDAMYTAFILSLPLLLISVAVGLVISIFQAATQIHEQTLSFVPKLIAIAVMMLVLGPWMMEQMNEFLLTSVVISVLLSALIFYLKHEAPEDEQNFPMKKSWRYMSP